MREVIGAVEVWDTCPELICQLEFTGFQRGLSIDPFPRKRF
ncbi:MAG: hypothetical protein WCF10_09455 [Polyangiales bacterium]